MVMRRDPIMYRYWVEVLPAGLRLKDLPSRLKRIDDYTVELSVDGSLVITLFAEGTEPIKIKLTSNRTPKTIAVGEIRHKSGLHIGDNVYWHRAEEAVSVLDKSKVKRVFFWTDDRWYVVCFDRDPYWHPRRIVLAYDFVDYVNIAMREVV